MWLQVINKVKFIHQGEGHIKVKVKYQHPFKFYVAHTFCKRVVCIQLNAFLFKMLWTLGECLNVELVSVLINLISNHMDSFGLMAISVLVTDTVSPVYGSPEERS